ncbi:hypothetical protein JS565_22680 [Salmonella enterica subsp. enterica serovar Senftenberg]|nr:hypothetical protein [Salmonella enterica subsp. enterica serovar Senftenberg]
MIKNRERSIPVQWRKYSQSVHWNAFCGALRKITLLLAFSRQRDPFL